MAEEQKKPRTRGKDRKPRRTEGYQKSSPKNLVKARENSPIVQGQKAELPEGYNARLVSFMIEIVPTEPLDLHDVPEMERRFANYLQKCAEQDMKVGNQAAYMAIGITKQQAWEWENNASRNPARADFIKKVRQICGVFREGLMQDGKVNPVTGIFWQKNYDGMKDQQEVVLTPNASPLGEQKNAEALKQKYLDATYSVAELPESAEGTESEVLEIPQKVAESSAD